MNYTEDNNFREGKYVGHNIAGRIDGTIYKTLETAVKQKEELIRNFEEPFGYTKEMESFDRNYAYNLGILAAFKEELNKTNAR